MTLDYLGRARLAQLQQQFGSDCYQDVPTAQGSDSRCAVSLSIDAACRIVDVRVHDLGALRTPAALDAALGEAFRAADEERAEASLRTSGAFEQYAACGAAMLRGEVPSLAAGRGDVVASVIAELVHPDATDDDLPTEIGAPLGRSGNGYLALAVNPDGSIAALEVDAAWLSAATADRLRRALLEASHALREGH